MAIPLERGLLSPFSAGEIPIAGPRGSLESFAAAEAGELAAASSSLLSPASTVANGIGSNPASAIGSDVAELAAVNAGNAGAFDASIAGIASSTGSLEGLINANQSEVAAGVNAGVPPMPLVPPDNEELPPSGDPGTFREKIIAIYRQKLKTWTTTYLHRDPTIDEYYHLNDIFDAMGTITAAAFNQMISLYFEPLIPVNNPTPPPVTTPPPTTPPPASGGPARPWDGSRAHLEQLVIYYAQTVMNDGAWFNAFIGGNPGDYERSINVRPYPGFWAWAQTSGGGSGGSSGGGSSSGAPQSFGSRTREQIQVAVEAYANANGRRAWLDGFIASNPGDYGRVPTVDSWGQAFWDWIVSRGY